MKISASLPDDDVTFLDRFAREHGQTRSAALHRAVTLLRYRELADQYETAWTSDDAEEWEATVADGLTR